MCWKCDAIAPQCRAVTPEAWENLCLACPDQTSYDSDDLAADFPEIFIRTKNQGTQTGSLLWPDEGERGRAGPLMRPLPSGMTARRLEIRAAIESLEEPDPFSHTRTLSMAQSS